MQPPGSPAKAWLMVTLCAVMMGFNYADKGILGFAAQPIMRDFKLSPVEFGYLGSSFFLLFAVSGIVLGFLADRWPSKHVMTAMAIGWALCLLPAAGQVGFVGLMGTRMVGADVGSEIWKFSAHALERGPSYLDLHFGISLVAATLYATVALSRIDSSQIVPVIGRGFSV